MNTFSVTHQSNVTRMSSAVSMQPAPAANGVISRKQAVEEIYGAYAEQIYKFVYYKVGNREDAEDITSQVFIKAANGLDFAQDARTQVAWLYQVARTTITDYWRLYYKVPSSSLEEMDEASPLHLAAEPMIMGAPETVEVEPAMALVAAIMDRLPENYRQVLEFRFLKGYSLKETAAAMSVTEANVKVLQHRAIAKAVKISA